MPIDERTVLPAERRRRLLELLGGRGAVRVTELADELTVSASTVRRDLAGLHRDGRIVRVHGGAGSASEAVLLSAPTGVAHEASKRAIGRAAAATVVDHSTIMLLSGSTTASMVPFLGGRRGLTVVTNGLDIAYAVAHTSDDVGVVLIGGVLHRPQMTLIGSIAEHNMQAMHVDQMFGGAYGVDATVGVTGPKLIQGGRRDLLKHAASLTVLADGSKFGRTGPARLADPAQITSVLTDSSAPSAEVAALRAAGVHVVICN